MKAVKPRMPSYVLTPAKQKPSEMYKIKKNNDPSPCSYNPDESFKSSQLPKQTFFTSKQNRFSDAMLLQKKGIPSVGTYDVDKATGRISKGVGKSWK